MNGRPTKICATCGRSFEWRKAWTHVWAEVRYCSTSCRRHKPNRTDRALEDAIVSLVSSRAANATICPSEAAREVGGADWRPLMERTRRAARRLAEAGEVVITQGGRPVDPTSFVGPIRIRRVRRRPV